MAAKAVLPTQEEIDRFWSKVDKNGPIAPGMTTPCWIYERGRFDSGYGAFSWRDKTVRAHRFGWMVTHGEQPPPALRHTCHVRACVRHTIAGGHKENMRDMVEAGRQASGDRSWPRMRPELLARGDRNGSRTHPEKVPRGERHWNASLTDTEAGAVRDLYATGAWTQVELALEFSVTQGTISRIIRLVRGRAA